MDSSWKSSWYTFFFLSESSPFLGLYPFEKIRMKFDACRILWTVHARVLKFHLWILHGKIADPYLCPQLRRSWRGILVSGCASLHPSVCLKHACHILWTMHARLLKFHIWIPHGKITDQYFFLVRVISLSGVMPLWKIRMKSDACHILWTVHARVLKFLIIYGFLMEK